MSSSAWTAGPVGLDRGAAVPFVDLGPANVGLKEQVLADIGELIETGGFTNGRQVAEFEGVFADACGASACVGVASGLDALRLSLLAAGIGPGDEVVVPANTFIATLEAVSQVGAVPAVADVTFDDCNLDVQAVDASLGHSTRAILPVHLHGQLADMRGLEAVARRHDLTMVEDACQAHGARRDGIRPGALSRAAAFSFYPTKNLGAMGDAGAVITGDQELAERIRILREHGQTAKYCHDLIGYTARLDTIQALVLLRKLPLLAEWTDARRRAACYYDEALAGVGDLVRPAVPAGSEPVWHVYAIRTCDPQALGDFLRDHGIGTGRHYPEPVHLTAAYASLGYKEGAFPVAEALARELLSLPLFPGISDAQLDHVVDTVRRFFSGG